MKKIGYLILAILLLNPIHIDAKEIEEQEFSSTENTEIVTLEACVDGDTARFLNQKEETMKTRFLAIDTPETVHPTKEEEPFGKDASDYTCEMLTNAEEIKLEYDENSDETDYYGRRLAWVFVDGVLLQDLLVKNGYAEVTYLYDDYKYTSLLQESESIAKTKQIGIWSIEEEKQEEEQENKESSKDSSQTESNFFNQLVAKLTNTVVNFIDDLLEKVLNMIEDML